MGIGDIGNMLGSVLVGNGVVPNVCIGAGGNDIGRVRRQELFKRYREILGRVKDLGGTSVVCDILPRRSVRTRWWYEALAMNSLLTDHCKTNGCMLLDH